MKNEQNQEWTNPLAEALTNFLPQTKSLQQQKNGSKPSKKPTDKKKSSGKVKSDKAENRGGRKGSDYDSQCIVNMREIKNGIVRTADGNRVKILEVLPLNFYEKDNLEKNKITDAFFALFKTCPDFIHIKSRTEQSDTVEIIKKVQAVSQSTTSEEFKKCAEDYVSHIKMLNAKETVGKKFYVSFAYDGKKKNFDDIYNEMRGVEYDLRSKLASCGNAVVVPENENYHACEVLYKFYNPVSCQEEPLQARIDRIYADSAQTGDKPCEADFIAPRGLESNAHRDYIFMDGMYHTFLVIKDNSYPPLTQTGWLDNIPSDMGVDVDIYARRKDSVKVAEALKQMRKYKYSSYNSNAYNLEKAQLIARDIKNTEYIKSAIMEGDEDLFSVMIFITIRDVSYRIMRRKAEAIKKKLEGISIYTAGSFYTAHEYLKSAAPDMYCNRLLLQKYSHNLLTRNMAQLYPFTSMSLFDNNGYVMGRNVDGGSLIAFNNFNTKLYSNGNIGILGTSGSGKTFLELMLAYRMRLMGTRVMSILPLKAHEYYNACYEIGGEYIRFIPGGKACVNIMEIRPQAVPDGMGAEESGTDAPLLAKKISSLSAWLQLNMMNDRLSTAEKAKFSVLCTRLYNDYGITSDNDSIWKDKKKGILKKMPILQDLNDYLMQDRSLSRIKDVLAPYMRGGMFENFNGYTNVNLKNQFLVFDVDKASVGEDYLPSMMYIAFDCCYDLAKQNLTSKDAVILDEAWLMMQNEDCAKQVKEMVKIIRGYGSCTIIASQDIGDFLRSGNGAGRSILESSKVKFLLKVEDMELDEIASCIDINENDRANFKRFPSHGRAMMVSSNDKMILDLIASDRETKIFNTDVNLRTKAKKEGR